ncbi:flavonol synthase/flavanone 3-hydroxylase isoform X1 [Cajanus cajan]|uniref:Flavonol synthase/flavanone 3-hydroxylase n=1 Tax=Cajanus cajan TaxID=3821 RepID=A0A151TF69_CAJCA|nr:flavonol synthase/flavanone 3-hydroxylase isoform X2 [Cajanus cajan]XP_029127391.1 flavonol synthase/flavanone 3-hydroxylase isoform X1 [Cajanus cajan]KYP65673.1 Flavonol synthase/flavanone 3-hydroxylase [Cajanus cajan]
MGDIDPSFIREPECRPQHTLNEEGIPVIDLSGMSDPSAIGEIVKAIGNACKEWGFFQVINHGTEESHAKVDAVSRKFFNLNKDEKNKVRRDIVQVMGYYDSEHTQNSKDWKESYEFVVEEPTLMPLSIDLNDNQIYEWNNKWPQNPPEFREVCKEYAKVMETLAFKLLEYIFMSLGLPPKRFHEFFKGHQSSFVKINYYPPCPSPDLVLGCGPHKDTGALVILPQDDVGGLEVRRQSDGEWVKVKPIPGAYVVNVGDVVQVWSNDAYQSVEHRVVVNSKKERLSTPFSLQVPHFTVVEPLEEFTNAENPPKYKPYNWGKFLAKKKFANFQKIEGESIQIKHFKIY